MKIQAVDFHRFHCRQISPKADVAEADVAALHGEFVLRDLALYVFVIMAFLLLRTMSTTVDSPTPPAEMLDAAHFLFEKARTSPTPSLQIRGREDIRSFAFDLGGSTCACLLQWDTRQYWQRVFYGTKYVVFHCTTAFFGVFCLQRPQWVVIWKVLNEVLEELGMGIVARFAWTGPVMNVEARYDTLVNDLLLALIPFGGLGWHLVTVLNLSDPLPLRVWKPCLDLHFILQFVCVFLQYEMFNQANQTQDLFAPTVEWKILGSTLQMSKLTPCLMQIGLIWLLQGTCKLSTRSACVTTCVVGVMWAPFVLDGVGGDEQIIAMLSFAMAGLGVCAYQVLTNTHLRILYIAFPCYVLILGIYLTFDSVLKEPRDRFYFHNQWCGLSDASSTNKGTGSCQNVKVV
jgi:hypothetical protein